MPFTYQILGKDEAQKALSQDDHGFTHVVSCQGSHGYYPEALDDFEGALLVFKFDDIKQPLRGYIVPKPEDIQALLNFNIPHGSHVLFHCAAGVSRSSASAFIKLCQAYGLGFEKRALEEIIQTRPCAYPNELMIRMADTVMDRKGHLRQAYYKEYLEVRSDRKYIIHGI